MNHIAHETESCCGGGEEEKVAARWQKTGLEALPRGGDFYEKNPELEQDDDDYWKAVRVIHDEIEKLPLSEKAAYLEAQESVPAAIFRKEANALQFLRFEGWNGEAAAKRVCTYWTKRRELFVDRWALPVLCVDGSGALNSNDLCLLTKGVVVKLPSDRTGRPVLFLNKTRAEEVNRNDVSRIRYWFFWFQEITFTHPDTSATGLCVIRWVQTMELNKEVLKQISDLGKFAFPVGRIFPISCCMARADTSAKHSAKRAPFTKILAPVAEITYATLFASAEEDLQKSDVKTKQRKNQSTSHATATLVCDSADDIRNELFSMQTPQGLHYFDCAECLPVLLGGRWDYSKFEAWVQQRVRHGFEKSMATTMPIRKPTSVQRNQVMPTERALRRSRIKHKMDVLFCKRLRGCVTTAKTVVCTADLDCDICFTPSKQNRLVEPDS